MNILRLLEKRLKLGALYVITDSSAQKGRTHLEVLSQALEGAADVVQLRDKFASNEELIAFGKQLRPLCRKYGALFIINDRFDVAEAIGADGVHIGQSDLPVSIAKSLLSRKRFLGVSTHSLDQALQAEEEGADYIGVGPIFQTPTKPDYPPVGPQLISEVNGRIRIPFVAIGGINLSTLDTVLDAGAQCVAVVRAVVAQEDIRGATEQLRQRVLERRRPV